jgi:hypothetical protein
VFTYRLKGHLAKNCRYKKERRPWGEKREEGISGNEDGLSARGRQAANHYSIGCIGSNSVEYVELAVEESKTRKIRFLLDTGPDISLVKSSMLARGTEFDPDQKVKIKSVNESIVETHGTLVLHILGGGVVSPFKFHLVNKQVDLVYDGILGRDFLRHSNATIYYEEGLLTFRQGKDGTNVCPLMG